VISAVIYHYLVFQIILPEGVQHNVFLFCNDFFCVFMLFSGHIARMGREEAYTGFWWGNLRERDHLEDPGIDGRIILRWIFRKWDVVDGLDRPGSG
jgi:hypothetical protein